MFNFLLTLKMNLIKECWVYLLSLLYKVEKKFVKTIFNVKRKPRNRGTKLHGISGITKDFNALLY